MPQSYCPGGHQKTNLLELRQTCHTVKPRIWSYRREAITEKLSKVEKQEKKSLASLTHPLKSPGSVLLCQNSARRQLTWEIGKHRLQGQGMEPT